MAHCRNILHYLASNGMLPRRGVPKRVYVENTECLTYMSTKLTRVSLFKYVATYKDF